MKAKQIKIINLIVAVLVALFAIGQAFAWLATGSVYLRQGFGGSSAGAYFAYGNGSKAQPFGINTKYHMYNLAWLQNTGRLIDSSGTPTKYYFELDPDMEETLDMGDMWLPPIGNDENPFMGEFNGNGKSLANLRITTDKSKLTANPASENYEFSNAVGMFGMTKEGSVVANFILTNPIVEAASTNTKYATEWNGKEDDTHSKLVIGLAIGHVAGKCYSVGVRATKVGTQSTTLMLNKVGYSTFNSILGELGSGVESSVTGGGHTMGSGGSGNAFGASFDVAQLATRLNAIEANKGASSYLPKVDTKSDVPVPALGYKVAFTVDKEKSTYTGDKAVEVVANDNIGYDMGNQNKISLKKLNFTDNLMEDSNDGNHQYYLGGVEGSYPDNNHVPRWFYVQGGGWQNSGYRGIHGFAPISQAKYDSLPQNVKDLLTTTESIGVLRIQAGYTQYSSAPLYANTQTLDAHSWNYHGQISWMGNTYGKGFADSDGYAVNEDGIYYTANGNLMGAGGYDIDESGHYAVDPGSYPDFPYVVNSIDINNNTAYAKDENGNRYYRYNPENSGVYVYGILDGGYMKTGADYESYVASVVGWTQPITIIDANGYAMYAAGVYYDASGNIVEGAYVKDESGLYIAADTAFNMPISQIIDGYAQDADGNFYGKITLNERTVYCYLGSDGKTAGYDGFYLIDDNAFLKKAVKVDAEGYVMYNDTDYYGTYDGVSGYVDANGYFYDENHVYVVSDNNFTYIVSKADASGHAMTSDDIYYGKYKNDYGYLDGTYFYTVIGEQKYYVVNDSKFTDAVNRINGSGYAMTSDDIYYGKYNNDYGYLDGTYFYTVIGEQKYYVVNDNNFSYEVSKINENGYAMTSDGKYYGKYRQENWHPYSYGYLDDIYFYTLVDGQKVYVVRDGNFNYVVNLIDENGYAMVSASVYYGKYNNDYGYLDGTYLYTLEDGQKVYVVNESNFNYVVSLIDENGNAMVSDSVYYGKYNNNYGYLDGTYFYTLEDGKKVYVVNDSEFNSVVNLIDKNGYAMASADAYYGKGIRKDQWGNILGTEYGYLDGTYFYTLVDGQKSYLVSDSNFNYVVSLIDENGYAMVSDGVYYGKYRDHSWDPYNYGSLEKYNNKFYVKLDGKYLATDNNTYDKIDLSDGRVMIGNYYCGVDGLPLDNDGYVYDEVNGYYIDSSHWSFNNYEICTDPDEEYYGYYVLKNDHTQPYINYYDKQPLKAWGYTLEELSNYRVGPDGSNIFAASAKKGTFLYAKEGEQISAVEGERISVAQGGKISAVEGEQFSVETGENVSVVAGANVSVETGDYISVEKGVKTQAIGSDEINGIEGEFITPKEIEKVKVVTSSDKLDSVTVRKGDKVIFNNFSGGIALPNNGLWFKPSQAGTVRFVMLAQKDSEAFCLLKITRTLATKEDPFYIESGDDIKVEKVMQQQMPPYVLFYYEIDVTERDIENGNVEYCIMVDNNVTEETEEGETTTTSYKGAYFVYLDIGASAAEDVSGVVPEKGVSAVDFIYEGVEIEQLDTTIGVGNFIVNTSGTKALYNSSKTSIYFENISKALKIVFLRLNNDNTQGHSGKTICLEDSDPKLNKDSEVMATYATYVCPTISGGSGTVISGGGGGSGTVTPNPDPTPDPNPDNPDTPTLTVTNTSLNMTVGGGTQKINATASAGATITYTSNDESVVTVGNDGTVTVVGEGSTTITVTATNGTETTTETVSVTVNPASTNPEPSSGSDKITMSKYSNVSGGTFQAVSDSGFFEVDAIKNYTYYADHGTFGEALVATSNDRGLTVSANNVDGVDYSSIKITLRVALANSGNFNGTTVTVKCPAGATITCNGKTTVCDTAQEVQITTTGSGTDTICDIEITLSKGQSVTIESGRFAFLGASSEIVS